MSQNRKRKPKAKIRKDNCPCAERGSGPSAETHNSADWYTREIVPQIGANFSVLTTMQPETRLLTNGMYVNALTVHSCAVAPPLDEHSSFHQKMLDLYTELREVNAGAANYNPVLLGVYVHNVVMLRTLCAEIRRCLSAVRYASAMFRESPNIFVAAAGLNDYDAETAAYADNFNDFALLCKDAEELPIPGFAMLDRMEFLFDKVFCDSQTTRPAMISFIVRVWYEASESGGAYAFSNHGITDGTSASGTTAAIIAQARALYASIIAQPVNAIIRGDMIKAFGNTAMRRSLVASISKPFSIGYSPDVVSQLENTAIIQFDAGGTTCVVSATGGPAYLTGTRSQPETAYILGEDRRVINFHGETAPSGATLVAITRLAVTGEDASTLKIDSASGVIVMGTSFYTVSAGKTTRIGFVGNWIHDTHSSIQSTVENAYKKLMSLCTLVDHFPMVLHHPGDPDGAMLDVDNAAYISADTLRDMTEVANRSLYTTHIPRKADGHFMR